jgi:sugar fermentation stimulation protein A
MNSHLPNRLLRVALVAQALPWFASYGAVRSEASLGDSRLDFQLADNQERVCWLEAKSVTLVEGGIAQFPDAPTKRGRRHLRELIAARERGDCAAVVFVVQRDDAVALRPRDETDPEFGAALRAAADAGVEIKALSCAVTTERICLDRPIPVSLDGDTRPAIISAEADEN